MGSACKTDTQLDAQVVIAKRRGQPHCCKPAGTKRRACMPVKQALNLQLLEELAVVLGQMGPHLVPIVLDALQRLQGSSCVQFGSSELS